MMNPNKCIDDTRSYATDAFLPLLKDAASLVQIVGSVTSKPTADVVRRLALEHQKLGSNANAELSRIGYHRGIWNETLIDFYSSTDSFLYESIVWNRTPEKCRMRGWIADWITQHVGGPARVLVYGDGPGFDSLYLSTRMHRVDYFEVSEYCIEFARHIFNGHGAPPAIMQSSNNEFAEEYDVVVCLDVLEHVPDPTETVQLLASALCEGGYLIVHAPFWYLGRKVPTHLRSNRRFSGDFRRLYKPFGLEMVDGCFFWNPIVLRKSSRGGICDGERRTAGIHVTLGGWLLSMARLNSIPHTLAFELFFSDSPRHWPELELLKQEFGVHDNGRPVQAARV